MPPTDGCLPLPGCGTVPWGQGWDRGGVASGDTHPGPAGGRAELCGSGCFASPEVPLPPIPFTSGPRLLLLRDRASEESGVGADYRACLGARTRGPTPDGETLHGSCPSLPSVLQPTLPGGKEPLGRKKPKTKTPDIQGHH